MAHHLARTALDLMAKLAAEVEPLGIRCAERLIASADWDKAHDSSGMLDVISSSRRKARAGKQP
jgi:hypothetical protein